MGRIPGKGDRIELISMGSDENEPVPVGSRGTLLLYSRITGGEQLVVQWDDPKHQLSIISPPDRYRVVKRA